MGKFEPKKHPGYDYMEVEVTVGIAHSANHWNSEGWVTVSVIPPVGLGRLGYSLLLRRRKQNPYNQLGGAAEHASWAAWEKTYGDKFDQWMQ